jgi:hypothetical protein
MSLIKVKTGVPATGGFTTDRVPILVAVVTPSAMVGVERAIVVEPDVDGITGGGGITGSGVGTGVGMGDGVSGGVEMLIFSIAARDCRSLVIAVLAANISVSRVFLVTIILSF